MVKGRGRKGRWEGRWEEVGRDLAHPKILAWRPICCWAGLPVFWQRQLRGYALRRWSWRDHSLNGSMVDLDRCCTAAESNDGCCWMTHRRCWISYRRQTQTFSDFYMTINQFHPFITGRRRQCSVAYGDLYVPSTSTKCRGGFRHVQYVRQNRAPGT